MKNASLIKTCLMAILSLSLTSACTLVSLEMDQTDEAMTSTTRLEFSGISSHSTPTPPVTRSGFTREDFETLVDVRIGNGDPVYWYGVGVVYSFPDGEVLARVEGVDLGKLYRPDPSVPSAQMYTRKFIVFRDPKTNELLRDEKGKIRFIGFNYQNFTWRLEGDYLMYDIEQGSGNQVFTVTEGRGNEIRKMGGLTVITTPVFVETPVGSWWEKYDLLIQDDNEVEPRYQYVWSRYGPNFSFMGGGFNTMSSWLYRYDNYDDMPQSIRDIIENEPGMDLWRNPPMDAAEIQELQKSGGNYR